MSVSTDGGTPAADPAADRRAGVLPGVDAVFDLSTPLGRDYAAVDWTATPLGPVHNWPASLRNTVRLITSSRFSMWVGWGPELIFFCNDAYRRDTLGAKYPWALGRPAAEVWAEIWPDLVPRIDSVMRDGVATWDEALLLFLERSGYVEETYHTFSYSPLAEDDGRIAGLLCVVSEDTGRVVSERRITTLRDLGNDLAKAATEDEVYAAAQRQLATDPYNLPFVIAYVLEQDRRTARRRFTLGIDDEHPAAPATVDVDDPSAPWSTGARADGTSTRVPLAERFTDLPTGAWAHPPHEAMTLPLLQPGVDAPSGFLVVALNRHRPLDADYLGFLDLVTGQVAAAVTRARAFEAERLRAEQMAELDRAKTTFFTNVSHELRTPLTLLLGPAEDALADPELTEPHRRHFEVVHRNGERLLKLVNTLLDFSRLESGRTQAHYEPLELDRYTTELASMFDSAFSRAGLELEIRCDRLDDRFYVDREMWAKIVLNLLSNALKATFEGGATVTLEAVPDGARLTVTDTGVGIAAGEREHLFERFHRISGAALRTHEGSGIGLALVAELVALHGGAVAVESEFGAGSSFLVTIPSGTAHLPADRVSDTVTDDVPAAAHLSAGYLAEALRWVEPAVSAPVEGNSSEHAGRPRVLVVDDNADMRDYIGGLLGEQYAVTAAADGAAALERAAEDVPDLVLTDVMMPRLDGFGLLAGLRANPATVHVPVVMLSARSGEDAAIEGLEAGADDYLVKPFSTRELLARVRANLELDRVRRLVDEIERSRRLLAQAEEVALVGSFDYDLDADVLVGSAQLHRMLNLSAEQLRTSLADGLDVVHPEDRDALVARLQQCIADGVPMQAECRVGSAEDERIFWVNAVPETDGGGRTVRLHGSVQDITERREGERALTRAAAADEAAAREHAIAEELQRSLLPARSFDADHLDVATFYRAGVEGTEVGGDWYDVIELDAGRTALVLGDVMGRGVRAAAVMGQLRATVRAYARLDLPPDYLLHLLDSAVREISNDTIVTCVYAVYDPADRSLVYANAGHLPPLLSRPGQPVQRLTAGGPPLGTGRTWARPETVILEPGAVLTLYTDGLVEERGGDLDEGIDRLAAQVAGVTSPVDAVPDRLVQALRPGLPDDDIAVLLARVSDRSVEERFASVTLPDDGDLVRHGREFALAHLAEWDVPVDVRYDIELVVSELVTNALRHGRPPVELRLRRAVDRLFVDVHDAAAASPRMRHAGPSDDNGRGLLIVATLAERWGTRHTATGKSVWCLVRLPS